MAKLNEMKAKPGRAKAPVAKHGPLDKVIIDAGKNGFSVQAVYKPTTNKQGMSNWGPEEDPSFFNTLDEAFDCARGIFGGKKPAPDGSPAHEKAESKAKEKAEKAAGDTEAE